MKRIIALTLFAVATVGNAADTTIYYGPDGATLQPGKYWRVTVSWQNGQPVVTQNVVMEIGGDIPPPPPPPVTDIEAKIKSFLAAVTDANKGETASKLAKGYAATIGFADAGTIKEADALRTIQQQVDKSLLSNLKKTTEWKPWTDGMIALVASMDFAGTLAAYKVAQAQLGGVPNPPPPPAVPVKVTGLHVMMLHDQQQTLPQAQANVLTAKQIRDWLTTNCEKDKAGTPAFRVLGPKTDLAKETDATWHQLAEAASSAGVADPYWVLIDSQHWSVEPLPATVEAAMKRLAAFKGGAK